MILRGLLVLLLMLVMASTLAIVYSKHESRKLFVELKMQQKSVDDLNVEWGRLQLEQGTLATHGLVEKKAREELGLERVTVDQIVYIERKH